MSEYRNMIVVRDITGKDHEFKFGDTGLEAAALLWRLIYPGASLVRFVVNGEDQPIPDDMPTPAPHPKGNPLPFTPDRTIWHENNDWDEQR